MQNDWNEKKTQVKFGISIIMHSISRERAFQYVQKLLSFKYEHVFAFRVLSLDDVLLVYCLLQIVCANFLLSFFSLSSFTHSRHWRCPDEKPNIFLSSSVNSSTQHTLHSLFNTIIFTVFVYLERHSDWIPRRYDFRAMTRKNIDRMAERETAINTNM